MVKTLNTHNLSFIFIFSHINAIQNQWGLMEFRQNFFGLPNKNQLIHTTHFTELYSVFINLAKEITWFKSISSADESKEKQISNR